MAMESIFAVSGCMLEHLDAKKGALVQRASIDCWSKGRASDPAPGT